MEAAGRPVVPNGGEAAIAGSVVARGSMVADAGRMGAPRLDKQLNTHNGQHVHGTSVGAGHVQGLKAHTSAIDGSMVSDSMAGTHSHIITCRRSEVAR